MLQRAVDAIVTFIDLGGTVVAVILLLSVFALALILLKLVQFRREQVGRHRRTERALHAWFHSGYAEARGILDADRSPAGSALSAAMRLATLRTVPKEAIEDEVARIALSRLHDLQRGFRALDAVVQIAPLLGLFGTVLGMIEAFRELQSAGNAVDPSLLAGGIGVALLTTAAVLAVAMPVSLVLTWFETVVENERVAIETMTSAILTHNAAHGQPQADRASGEAVAEIGHAH